MASLCGIPVTYFVETLLILLPSFFKFFIRENGYHLLMAIRFFIFSQSVVRVTLDHHVILVQLEVTKQGQDLEPVHLVKKGKQPKTKGLQWPHCAVSIKFLLSASSMLPSVFSIPGSITYCENNLD